MSMLTKVTFHNVRLCVTVLLTRGLEMFLDETCCVLSNMTKQLFNNKDVYKCFLQNNCIGAFKVFQGVAGVFVSGC